MKIPKKLGDAIDLAYTLRAIRLEHDRAAEAESKRMKAEEEEINTHIIAQLKASKLDGGRGSICTASWSEDQKPSVKDWAAVYAYIYKHKAFDLLERRIGKLAFKARLENNEKVPGIETFDIPVLHLTKIGEKA